MVSIESYLPFISGFDIYVVKTLANIELGKILGPTELQDKLGDQRQGVLVFNCYRVEGLIVLD